MAEFDASDEYPEEQMESPLSLAFSTNPRVVFYDHEAAASLNRQPFTWTYNPYALQINRQFEEQHIAQSPLESMSDQQFSVANNFYVPPNDQQFRQQHIALPPASPLFLHQLPLELRDNILDQVVDADETSSTLISTRPDADIYSPRFADVLFTKVKSGLAGACFDAREHYARALVRAIWKRRLIVSITIMDLDYSVPLKHLLHLMPAAPHNYTQGEPVKACLKFRMHFSDHPTFEKAHSLQEYLQWRFNKMETYGETYMTTKYSLARIGVAEGNRLGPAMNNIFPIKELQKTFDARHIYRFLYYMCYVREIDMGEDCIDEDELKANYSPLKPSGLADMDFTSDEDSDDENEDEDDDDDEEEETAEETEEVQDNSDPTRWDGWKVPRNSRDW